MLSSADSPMLTTIRRGRFIREAILGQSIPEPPANVGNSPEAKKALAVATDTLRQRLAKATSAYACDFCHRQLNPMGDSFGSYGVDGGWQTEEMVDPGASKKMVAIDDTVDPNIQVMGEGMVNGGVEMSKVLGQSKEAKLVFAKLWYQALAGRPLVPNAACVTKDMFAALGRGEPTLELLKIFVSSPEFLWKTY
jgi:hypothetical protein